MRVLFLVIVSGLVFVGCDEPQNGEGRAAVADASTGDTQPLDSEMMTDGSGDLGAVEDADGFGAGDGSTGAGGAGGASDAGGLDGGGGETGALIRHIIPAHEADDRITEFLAPNYVYLDTRVPQQDRLLVFLPGSNGNPERLQSFLEVAAGAGVHVIGLKYNNTPTLARLCSGQEPSCYEETRLDIIYGNGLRVDRAHSIENRLITLLAHLEREHPEQRWGQYLVDGSLDWSNIAFAGHSQGGGHAALIARDQAINRLIMLNSPSDAGSGVPAPWISDPHLTPAESYYAFIHKEDNGQRRLQICGLFGMDVFGDPVNVDTNEPPYNDTRIIYSERPTENAHAAVISDAQTPRSDDGSPLYTAAWRYLVGGAP